MPRIYVLRSVGRLTLAYVLLSVLVCSVYVVEKFAAIIDNALEYRFGFGTVVRLLLYTWPAMVEFALPLASFSAIYFILQAWRERRELLVLAAAGAGWRYLAVCVLGAALLAVLLSVAASGYLRPMSSFGFRWTQQIARNEVVAHGVPGGRFFAQGEAVLYSMAGGDGEKVFRYFDLPGGRLSKIIASDCADLGERHGTVIMDLCGGELYLVRQTSATDQPYDIAQVNIGQSQYILPMPAAFPTPKRVRPAELTTLELIAKGTGQEGRLRYRREAIGRLFNSLACLLAAAVAVVAIGYTRPGFGAVVYLVGCGVVMAFAASGETIAGALSGLGSGVMILTAFTGAIIGGAAIVMCLVRALYGRLIFPRTVKV